MASLRKGTPFLCLCVIPTMFLSLAAHNPLNDCPSAKKANTCKHEPTDNFDGSEHQSRQCQYKSTQHQTYHKL